MDYQNAALRNKIMFMYRL